MATYLIGYDLNSPQEAGEYTKLEDAIKSFGTWWHHLDSTWLVVTSMTAKEIRDKLQPHIKGGDELLVAKASGEAAWAGFSDRGSSWLKENL